jgi:hypothetical protein
VIRDNSGIVDGYGLSANLLLGSYNIDTCVTKKGGFLATVTLPVTLGPSVR